MKVKAIALGLLLLLANTAQASSAWILWELTLHTVQKRPDALKLTDKQVLSAWPTKSECEHELTNGHHLSDRLFLYNIKTENFTDGVSMSKDEKIYYKDICLPETVSINSVLPH